MVGGGPGGSAAAKKCAQHGSRTLLLEKKKLPRDKVCTGMVMGPWAQRIIQEEFGVIPQEILVSPYYLSGHAIHVPGVQPQVIEWRMPLAWRKDLDLWMNQRAKAQGVVIWDRAKVNHVRQKNGECMVMLEKGGKLQNVRAKFVIGADGAASVVRKSLFPGLGVKYSAPIRECYKGSLDIEKEYIHWFFPKRHPRPRFDLIHKGDLFLIEGSGIKELRREIETILGSYGHNPGTKPLWKDGCLMPLLHNALFSGFFTPARENILLIGDAAGLFFPITSEGIGAALWSGLLAADSIASTIPPRNDAAEIYLHKLQSLIKSLKGLYSLQKTLENAQRKGASELSRTLKKAYEATLRVVLATKNQHLPLTEGGVVRQNSES